MSDKRYYWIKLKTNFFNLDEIDFLLSQKNGCEYVVLYQMLCLNTANSNGMLESRIGEMIVPYNVDKIVRDTKHFDYDTVVVALELYKKLGLIYEDKNGCLAISNFDEMVGSETTSAKRVREWREKQKALQCNKNVIEDVTQENRVKSLDIRDKDIKEKNKEEDIKEDVQKVQEPIEPPVIQLILNDKSFFDVTKELYDEWCELYPNVDVMQELRNMKGWLNANPTKRKTKRGIKKFINGWLAREQDKPKYNQPRKEVIPSFMKEEKKEEPQGLSNEAKIKALELQKQFNQVSDKEYQALMDDIKNLMGK